MTRKEIINEINCLLSELDNGEDAVSYLTRNDVNWLNENIKVLEQESCEDAVSRKAVRDTIFAECSGTKLNIDFAKVLLLQRAIKALPPVTPQEQFKPMVEIDLYSVIKQSYIEREVLDKIRAEIEKQEKWLLQAGYNTYNVDIAFNSIKRALTESEGKE